MLFDSGSNGSWKQENDEDEIIPDISNFYKTVFEAMMPNL